MLYWHSSGTMSQSTQDCNDIGISCLLMTDNDYKRKEIMTKTMTILMFTMEELLN